MIECLNTSVVGERCGVNAVCNLELACECEGSFYRANDFSFSKAGTESDCFQNATALYSMFCLALATAVLAVILYTAAVRKRSQARRLIPFYICMGICATVPGLKISDLEGQEFGRNISLTLFLGLTIVLNSFASTVFLFKYVKVSYNMLSMKPFEHGAVLAKRKRLLTVSNVLAVLGFAMLTIVPFIDDLKTAEATLRVAFFIFSVHAYLLAIVLYKLVEELYRDIKSADKSSDDLIEVANNVLGIKRICVFTVCFNATTFLLIAIWEAGLVYAAYYIPFLIMSCTFGSIGTLFYNLKGRKQRKKRRQRALMLKTSQMNLGTSMSKSFLDRSMKTAI